MGKRANGEGSIYKRRADGRYCGAVVVNGCRRVVYGRTRDEVNRKLTAMLAAQHVGAPTPPQRETVATFFPAWLEAIQPTLRPRTWERYEQLVRVHVVPALGRARLARLETERSPALLQPAHRQRTESLDGAPGPRCCPSRPGHARRWDLVARNVADLVDPPRVRRREMRVLTSDEVRRLLAVARGSRRQSLLTVAVTTGMRQGELLGLRWREVDLDRAKLSVTATAQRTRRYGLVVAEPKTARSRRQIALTGGSVEALRRHRTAQAEQRLRAKEWEDVDLVFPNQVGRHQEVSRLLAEFRALLEAAGLPRIRFHDLRHTAATLMLGRGVHPKIASEMLGHSTVGMTLDLYSHVSETMQREAAATLDRLLWDRP